MRAAAAMLKFGMKIFLLMFSVASGARAQSPAVADLSAAMPAASRIVAQAKLLNTSCPAPASLSQPWVEHVGPASEAVLSAHLKAKLDGAEVMLLPINSSSWWIGSARRGRGDENTLNSPGCFVLGTAALYANGSEYERIEDQRTEDFVKIVESGKEDSLRKWLIELRWYDVKDGRKHRWYNTKLAQRLGWDVDGRGQPTDMPRPIPLPSASNELL